MQRLQQTYKSIHIQRFYVIESLTSYHLLIIALIALFAGFVHGSIGLGFPLLSTAILSTMIDLRLAILVTLLPTITVNLLSIAKGGNWSISVGKFWPLAVWCLIGSIAGAWVIAFNDPTPYKVLLALLIFLYLVIDRPYRSLLSFVKDYPKSSNLGFGLTAGFAAGSTNTMVPILVIYSLEAGWAKTVMIQVFNLCFLSGKAAQVAVFSSTGIFNWHVAMVTVPFAAVAAAGLFVGHTVQNRIDLNLFRKIIKFVLLVLGIVLLAQVLFL